MPENEPKYSVYVLPQGQTEYKLRGRTNDRDGAEQFCEQCVMSGPYLASKVVENSTGRILLETES
jgi:hypothetical protein